MSEAEIIELENEFEAIKDQFISIENKITDIRTKRRMLVLRDEPEELYETEPEPSKKKQIQLGTFEFLEKKKENLSNREIEDITESFLASFSSNEIKPNMTLEELENIVNKPLEVKIPIDTQLYEIVQRSKNSMHKNSKYKDDIVILDDYKRTDAKLRLLFESAILPMNFAFGGKGENLSIRSYDFIFRSPFEYMAEKFEYNLEYGRYTWDNHEKVETRQRSEFIVWDRDISYILFKTVEAEKMNPFEYRDICDELLNKLRSIPEILLGNNPFIICAVLYTNNAQLFTFDRKKNLNKLGKTYDLHDCYERLKLLVKMLNIASCSRDLNKNENTVLFNIKLLSWARESNSMASYYDYDSIIKHIKISQSNYLKSDIEVLKEIYNKINEGKIPFTIKYQVLSSPEDDILKFKLSPYCKLANSQLAEMKDNNYNRSKIESLLCILKALEALHSFNFVHRKVFWRNILYDSNSNEYILSDFECAGKANEYMPKYLFEENYAPYPDDVRSGKSVYSASVDIYQVAHLIAPGLADVRLLDLKEYILSNYKTITASQIIERLNEIKIKIFESK